MAINDLEKDQFIKSMLTGLSARTKENYLRRLPMWIAFVKMSPTQQIEKRLQDLTSKDLTQRTFFENKFREYKEALENQGNLKARSVTTMLTAVASFFGRNSLTLDLKRGDWKSTQQTEVIEQKMKVTQDSVKALYAHANLRDKCLLLVLAQSGFSEVDVSELKIEDIKDLYTMPQTEHYFIEKPREKTNQIQATCLSYEFLHDLRDMLAEKNNPTQGYIFTSQTKDTKRKSIEVRRINEIIKSLAEKTFGAEKAKDFHTKALRSFYNSALLRADIKSEIKDLMMGHARLGARGSYDYDEFTIKESYTKAFLNLSINGIQSREDINKIKEDMNKLIGSQQVQIEEQKKELSDMKGLMNNQTLKMESLSKDIATVTDTLKLIMDMKKQEKQQ